MSLAGGGTLAPVVTLSGVGAESAVLVVVAVQDDVDEGDSEVLGVVLGDLSGEGLATNVSGGVVADASAGGFEVVIADDDALPVVSLRLSPPSVVEGGTSVVTASLDRPSDREVALAVSAGVGVKLSQDAVLVIAAGATASAGAVLLTAVDDDADGPDLEVAVTAVASGGRGVADPVPVTLAVADNDEADDEAAAGVGGGAAASLDT